MKGTIFFTTAILVTSLFVAGCSQQPPATGGNNTPVSSRSIGTSSGSPETAMGSASPSPALASSGSPAAPASGSPAARSLDEKGITEVTGVSFTPPGDKWKRMAEGEHIWWARGDDDGVTRIDVEVGQTNDPETEIKEFKKSIAKIPPDRIKITQDAKVSQHDGMTWATMSVDSPPAVRAYRSDMMFVSIRSSGTKTLNFSAMGNIHKYADDIQSVNNSFAKK